MSAGIPAESDVWHGPRCRGVELVSALQQCISDAGCPAAAALGLEALGVLCEEDVLDFYKAWKVVHRWGHEGCGLAWASVLCAVRGGRAGLVQGVEGGAQVGT